MPPTSGLLAAVDHLAVCLPAGEPGPTVRRYQDAVSEGRGAVRVRVPAPFEPVPAEAAHAIAECVVEGAHPAGDHVIVVIVVIVVQTVRPFERLRHESALLFGFRRYDERGPGRCRPSADELRTAREKRTREFRYSPQPVIRTA